MCQQITFYPLRSISAGLEESINKLIIAGYKPNLIIIPPELSYSSDLLSSENYSSAYEGQVNPLSGLGYYRNIPITTFYTKNLQNQLIVTRFNTAFDLEIFEDSSLYYNRLHLHIRELSNEEIDTEYAKNRTKWLKDEKDFELTEEDAKARVATSLILEIWSRARFIIKDTDAISVAIINTTKT